MIKRMFQTIIWFIFIFFIICIGIFLFLDDEHNILDQNKTNYIDLGADAPEETQLNPIVATNTNLLIQRAKAKNIQIIITEDIRTISKQNELYNSGRSTAGLIITNAKGGESYHNYGLAIDYALKDATGNIIWDLEYDGNNNGEADWIEVANIGKQLGFEWGGDWKQFPDYPHLQMSFGLSIEQLKKGLRPSLEVE